MTVKMKQSPADLKAELLPDGRLLVRSRSLGVGAKLPSFAIGVLSFCASAKSRFDIETKMGPQAAILYDQLIDVGLLIDPNQTAPEIMFQNFAGLNVHRRMLSDTIRLAAYKEAIDNAVKPGDIVIDAGAGSGILSLYAAQAGAKRVYAIEASELATELKHTAALNDFSDTIVPIQANFASVELPEKANILITETFGAWALAEGAAADLKACIHQNLRPDARLLPNEICLWAAPISELPVEMLAPFENRWDKINLSAHADLAKKRSFNHVGSPNQLSGEAQRLAQLSLEESSFTSTLTLNAPCSGLVLWFDLLFGASHSLKTGPFDAPTHWKQTYIAMDLPAGSHHVKGYVNSDDKRAYVIEIDGIERIIR